MPLLTPSTATTIELHLQPHLGHNRAGTFQFLLTPPERSGGGVFLCLHSCCDMSHDS